MNKQTKLRIINISLAVIASISVIFNIYFVVTRTKPQKQYNVNSNQIVDENEITIEDRDDNKQEESFIVADEEKDEESKVEYIYKYIEGKEKEKQVIVEKEVEKTIEVPVSPTDAIVTYIDASGSTETINLPSGTAINFSAGEHGTYDTVPSSITLTDNQELDITDSSYSPSKVEVNYIFKGFSYSGDTLKCEYSLVNNTVDVGSMQIVNPIKIGEAIYIQLDYLESTGTQYIMLPITGNSNMIVKMKVKSLVQSECHTAGQRLSRYDQRNGFLSLINGGGTELRSDYGSEEKVYSNITPVNILNGYELDINKNVYKLSTSLKSETLTFSSQTFSNNYNICLFALNTAGTAGSFAKYSLQSCYISNGTTTLDLIPAERVSDGAIGMLDSQNGIFCANQGTGVFNHPDITLKPGVNIGKIMASGLYENGSSLELTAVANDGYRFVKWLDNNSTSATRTVSVGSNTTYTALFMENE